MSRVRQDRNVRQSCDPAVVIDTATTQSGRVSGNGCPGYGQGCCFFIEDTTTLICGVAVYLTVNNRQAGQVVVIDTTTVQCRRVTGDVTAGNTDCGLQIIIKTGTIATGCVTSYCRIDNRNLRLVVVVSSSRQLRV